MREAQAPRKLAVLGRFSDFPGTERARILEVANRAFDCVDVVVAVGPHAPYYLRAGQARGRTVYGFTDAEQARSFLKGFACAGDLILLKGSGVDHLGRVAADWHHDSSHRTALPEYHGLRADWGRGRHGLWQRRSSLHRQSAAQRHFER